MRTTEAKLDLHRYFKSGVRSREKLTVYSSRPTLTPRGNARITLFIVRDGLIIDITRLVSAYLGFHHQEGSGLLIQRSSHGDDIVMSLSQKLFEGTKRAKKCGHARYVLYHTFL